MLSERFDEAMVYASQLHRAQRRKGTDVPYISHLLSVAALVLEHGGSEDQAIAALLHDAVEDCGGEPIQIEIESRFGSAVAKIVHDCTDAWEEPKPEWRQRKETYLAAMSNKASESLLVALADKAHNARTIQIDLASAGGTVWDRFKGGREGTLWYYRTLSDFFQKNMPGPLATELSRSVSELGAE